MKPIEIQPVPAAKIQFIPMINGKRYVPPEPEPTELEKLLASLANAIKKSEKATHQIGEIKATIVVNFGPGRQFPILTEEEIDNWPIIRLMVKVFEHLIDKKGKA